MGWLSQYSAAVSALVSVATVFVWMFYAQILYRNYARVRRPRVIINRGGGSGLSAHCLISNMSSEPIFVSHVIAILRTAQGEFAANVIDRTLAERPPAAREAQRPSQDSSACAPASAHAGTEHNLANRQGPMNPGEYHPIGTFEQIIAAIGHDRSVNVDPLAQPSLTDFKELEIRLVAIYGSEDDAIGASRSFAFVHDTAPVDDMKVRCCLKPLRIDTHRYANRLQRRRVARWIRDADQY
ncbi:hypothetical protein [Salinicola rhizosphaerae]|uniref:Uncharacterized protein n=1 Tax=Salinicola rhizosphaerae TaxID=1443141 RepID=A0ABQ3EEZ2_9GAMM|nr:hypothetical protein [Salinicola rhizosphaerae]GHB34218.1 hypothetical protein GCM10009038_36620 [Salinicola rhizosphaerae]